MTKEVLKLAREALESCDAAHITDGGRQWYDEKLVEKALTAIDEALAQPEQRPVAFVKGCNRGQWEIFPAKAHQIFGIEQPLYAAPPQRTWVGLDEKDFAAINQSCLTKLQAATSAESILKEKNT